MRLQNKEQHFVSVSILSPLSIKPPFLFSPPVRGQKLNKPRGGGGLNRAFTVFIYMRSDVHQAQMLRKWAFELDERHFSSVYHP